MRALVLIGVNATALANGKEGEPLVQEALARALCYIIDMAEGFLAADQCLDVINA